MLAIETYHTYFDSPIGIIKIGGTETYINEIMFIDDKQQLQYSSTPGISDVLHECTEQLIEYFNGKRKVFNIAIHQEGTVFQQKVWGKLMDIKYGKTASYLEVSKQVGDEKAVRAVAASNGKNQISIITPCHRVIGTNKTLVGYSGGLWRKKWLLQHEFRTANGIQTLF
jgi:methylated-DNA-[protein]-cysteine S-methyltransferase